MVNRQIEIHRKIFYSLACVYWKYMRASPVIHFCIISSLQNSFRSTKCLSHSHTAITYKPELHIDNINIRFLLANDDDDYYYYCYYDFLLLQFCRQCFAYSIRLILWFFVVVTAAVVIVVDLFVFNFAIVWL